MGCVSRNHRPPDLIIRNLSKLRMGFGFCAPSGALNESEWQHPSELCSSEASCERRVRFATMVEFRA